MCYAELMKIMWSCETLLNTAYITVFISVILTRIFNDMVSS